MKLLKEYLEIFPENFSEGICKKTLQRKIPANSGRFEKKLKSAFKEIPGIILENENTGTNTLKSSLKKSCTGNQKTEKN